MPLHSPIIIQDARPQIVDTMVTLISMMGQGACRLPLYLLRWPILLLWMDVTMQHFDCWMGKTVNHWCSVHTHHRAHLNDILTVIGCSTIVHKMHTVFIGFQYTVSTNYHLHPRAMRPFSLWATTVQIIWMMNKVGPLCFSAFGRQFAAWKSIY